MISDPVHSISAYLLSALLDAFDGHAARLLNQSKSFAFAFWTWQVLTPLL